MMMKLSGKEWSEIAAFSLFASLASWVLYHSLHTVSAEPGLSAVAGPGIDSEPVETTPAATQIAASIQPITAATIPSLGYAPVALPGSSGCSGCSGGCGSSGGCGAGTTNDPTIGSIVSATNAAIAQMQVLANSTTQDLATIGNENTGVSGGVGNWMTFVTSPVS